MEKRPYHDDFENFLRETSDEFRMVPSRRVWYSIYNNIHPARKWPSVAVCLLFLIAILYIGISTNNSLSLAARKNLSAHMMAAASSSRSYYSARGSGKNLSGAPTSTAHANSSASSTTYAVLTLNDQTEQSAVTPVAGTRTRTSAKRPTNPASADIVSATENNVQVVDDRAASPVAPIESNGSAVANTDESQTLIDVSASKATADLLASVNADISANLKALPVTNTVAATTADASQLRSQMEEFAFQNKPADRGLHSIARLAYYVTPSIGYRDISAKDATRAGALNNVHDAAAVNAEVGAVLKLGMNRRVNLVTGLQVNYANYVSNATNLNHPQQTELAVTGDALALRSSQYSTTPGSTQLNNTSLQISVPFGAEVKLLSLTNKISWWAGANVQPGYVFGGKSFALSADGKNFIQDDDLVRHLSLNSSLSSFVSIKTGHGISFYFGPELRYQLMSSFRSDYEFRNRYHSLGLQMGITRPF